jgi:TetR/AcrR family transcriptional regulator, transcriptional repressor for nem operon
MARPKEFDCEQALERATELFWAKGYQATSMQDLVEHLGVNRQSLYDTFGDKDALFLAALRRYGTRYHEQIGLLLEAPRPARAVLADLLEGTIAWMTSGSQRGCFFANCTTELGELSAAAREHLLLNRGDVEAQLTRLLEGAQQHGELGRHRTPAALAGYFANALAGLAASAKLGKSADELRAIAQVTLDAL